MSFRLARVVKGYQPVHCLPDGLIAWRRNTLYRADRDLRHFEPICRLPVRAAWLRLPELTLEPLEQSYRRTGDRAYVYESGHGAFRANLEVDAEGMVVRYGDLWTAEGRR